MKIKRHQVIIAALIVLGIAFLAIGVLYQKDPVKYYAHSLRTWQEADSVAGYPIPVGDSEEGEAPAFITTEFQPNLSTLSPMERYLLPTARGFQWDAGPSARAAGTGLVLYTGSPEGYDGKAVLLGHRLPNGNIVQTFYAGLSDIEVRVGQHVPRGTVLGSGSVYFEGREGASIDIAKEEVAGHTLNSRGTPLAANRLTLEQFFAKYNDAPLPEDPLAIIQENNRPTFNHTAPTGGTQ